MAEDFPPRLHQRDLRTGCSELLPLLVYVQSRGEALAEAEPGEFEKDASRLLLSVEQLGLGPLLDEREPGLSDLGGHRHGDGLQVLAGGLHVQDGTALDRGDSLPHVDLVGSAYRHRDPFCRDREGAQPVTSREVRLGLAVPGRDFDLGPLAGGRLPGQGRGLLEPRPGLGQIEVVREGLRDKGIEGRVLEGDPPPFLIRLGRAGCAEAPGDLQGGRSVLLRLVGGTGEKAKPENPDQNGSKNGKTPHGVSPLLAYYGYPFPARKFNSIVPLELHASEP